MWARYCGGLNWFRCSSFRGSKGGTTSFANESLAQQLFGGRVSSFSPHTDSYDNLGEGSNWVLNHILEFCEKMGLQVEGKKLRCLIP